MRYFTLPTISLQPDDDGSDGCEPTVIVHAMSWPTPGTTVHSIVPLLVAASVSPTTEHVVDLSIDARHATALPLQTSD